LEDFIYYPTAPPGAKTPDWSALKLESCAAQKRGIKRQPLEATRAGNSVELVPVSTGIPVKNISCGPEQLCL
jgi:hypothetical protein